MNVIATSALCKSYGSKRAVDHFDMHVPKGAMYGFIGCNGAGKSTVMKMLAGLAQPNEGDILLFGMSGNTDKVIQRIGVLIENPGLYPRLSAYDNMMLEALCLGVIDPRQKVTQLLDFVGLSEVARKATKGFSMGMKQRLGLALALLGDPDLLLLDEPLNGLDPEGVREIRQLIVRLNEERGMTVVISSHVLDQLERMVTCYGVVRNGRMVREMSAAEVEQECSDFLQLNVAEPSRAFALLQERFSDAQFQAMPDGSIHIKGACDATQLGEVLQAEGIAVQGLFPHRRDLEEFFIEMMGAE